MGRLKIGIIGFGRLGKKHYNALTESSQWEVKYICDISENRRNEAQSLAPDVIFTTNENDIFQDPDIDAVALCTLADARFIQIEKAIQFGKHILSEKPIADTVENEWKLAELAEKSNIVCDVNLCQRNAWYNRMMKEFIQSGEIGELAIVRICHMTPGLAPGEGHEAEGPSFHDCGIHYLDMARWFADSEFKTGHAQAVRMWSYHDPWWLQCHGTFDNGVVFDVTQGHVYGQLSKHQTHVSYTDIIGTKGIVRMNRNFKVATVSKHGVTVTESIARPDGDKNMDVLYREFADAILFGHRNPAMPTFRDAAIASEFSWRMLEDAKNNDLPSIGTLDELEQILERRRTMKEGYGLLRK